MITRALFFFSVVILFSCSEIELVIKDSGSTNKLKNKTLVLVEGKKNEILAQELYLFLGSEKNGDFILVSNFSEKKENRLVKKNQVAEKVDYELVINYDLFYKNRYCKIYNKKIISKFSFVPKSFGYNFATDRSLDKLYKTNIRENIQSFINSVPEDKNCQK